MSLISFSHSSQYDRLSTSDKKRDDYHPPSKREDYGPPSKRDDFPAIKQRDDYVPSKRDDFGPPPSSKRDDYVSSKRDDYVSSKRGGGDDYKRDSYKRSGNDYDKRDLVDLPPRHGSSSYDNRVVVAAHRDNSMPKDHRGGGYNDHPSSDRGGAFRGAGRNMQTSNNLNNVTLIGGGGSSGGGGPPMPMSMDRMEVGSGGGGKPRYMESSSQNESRYGGNDRMVSSPWMNNTGPPAVKAFGNPQQTGADVWTKEGGWRSIDGGQDRYDRTYNERKSSPYPEPRQSSSGGGGGGGSGGTFISRPQDRYNNSAPSRFDNGRF